MIYNLTDYDSYNMGEPPRRGKEVSGPEKDGSIWQDAGYNYVWEVWCIYEGLMRILIDTPVFIWRIQNCFVILHASNEYKTAMITKEGTKRNMILHMLEYKRAMRECIQKGADSKEMKRITEQYGFQLATPLWCWRNRGTQLSFHFIKNNLWIKLIIIRLIRF